MCCTYSLSVAAKGIHGVPSSDFLPSYLHVMLAYPDLVLHPYASGPFNLGRWSGLIGTIAVAWTLASTVIFCLPSLYPLEFLTFNYTPGLLILVLLFAFASW